MSRQLNTLLLQTVIAGVITLFVNVFINLYIWQGNKELIDLVLFNFFKFSAWIIFYLIGSKIFYKTSLRTVFRLSALFYLILFSGIAFISFEEKTSWIIFAGTLFGVSGGTDSAGRTIGLSLIGRKNEFTTFYQRRDVWSQGTNIFTTLAFALLLFKFSFEQLFLVMVFLSAILFWASNKVPNVILKERITEPLFREFSIKKVFRSPKKRLLPRSFLTGSTFAEFQTIFLLFFTFTVTSNHLWVALLNITYTLCSLLAMYMYRRIDIREENWLFVGIFIAFSGLLMAMFLDNYWVILANVLLVFGNFYYRTTFYSQHYQVVSEGSDIIKSRIMIWRECLMAFSRLVLLGLILLLSKLLPFDIYFYAVMVFVFLISISVPFIHRKIFSIDT